MAPIPRKGEQLVRMQLEAIANDYGSTDSHVLGLPQAVISPF
jgi:hypothetical protein